MKQVHRTKVVRLFPVFNGGLSSLANWL